MASSDPIERAKAHARQMYPEAEVRMRSIRGKPIVLATTENLIRLVRLTDLDANRNGPTSRLADRG